ncbi:MAG: hypothetical protein COV07_04355 [Candidatus Vogelbacteria bacterium CG10_big_fil_rev_8_21_14_0_10_45_14]|uniref:Uncharacterized protein n=1 Tax=Candidatus Vogelbacteria bacterium CG10_big_fil_rev_8_21_14_0_10_45_14 TaxID=1975042 RepID=A0A2H0RIB2_9BACT|nr:MAG: hypothetical protein COV07_04355 [Candidatus Vogelbacteria bacterium CG10_big_fil_rev_8_21_14_0_10_45_14]
MTKDKFLRVIKKDVSKEEGAVRTVEDRLLSYNLSRAKLILSKYGREPNAEEAGKLSAYLAEEAPLFAENKNLSLVGINLAEEYCKLLEINDDEGARLSQLRSHMIARMSEEMAGVPSYDYESTALMIMLSGLRSDFLLRLADSKTDPLDLRGILCEHLKAKVSFRFLASNKTPPPLWHTNLPKRIVDGEYAKFIEQREQDKRYLTDLQTEKASLLKSTAMQTSANDIISVTRDIKRCEAEMSQREVMGPAKFSKIMLNVLNKHNPAEMLNQLLGSHNSLEEILI